MPYRVEETLPQHVLELMHAPPKSDLPVITPGKLEEYDAFLFGVPTRYGNFPTQWKAFFDHTGKQWTQGSYWGKYVGMFVSTSTPGGGQESTVISAMSTLAHHGMIYVPLGYKTAFGILSNLDQARGGSPWGAGTFAVSQTFLVELGCLYRASKRWRHRESDQDGSADYLVNRAPMGPVNRRIWNLSWR